MIDILSIVVLFFSIVLHECAHGWMANYLGDPTAKHAGRLTLNPLKHVDPVGTLLIPGILFSLRFLGYNTFLFGWAKPVPVNFARLRDPKKGMMWVGLAGPATNVALAVICSQIMKIVGFGVLYYVLKNAVLINLLLAILNMMPIPPLDGSRVVMGLVPNQYLKEYYQLERFGLPIIFGLVYFGLFERVLLPVLIICAAMLGVRF